MRNKLLVMAILPILLAGFAGCASPAPYPAPPPPGVIANRAYRAGVDAARHDVYLRLPPQAGRHRRFRYPPVPPGQPAAIYRRSFRQGYRWVYRGGR